MALANPAHAADTPALDETLTWRVLLFGESDLVTKQPELVMDRLDRKDGETSLSFETAGQGKPNLWLGLLGDFKTPINMADYESMSVSYKFTAKVLDIPPNTKQIVRLTLGKVGTGYLMIAVRELELDGKWHTLEVPISDFKYLGDPAESSEYNGEDANHIGFQMFFTSADSFDVAVKVDNIHLKPKP